MAAAAFDLVTIEAVKKGLGVDFEDDDDNLQLLISAASRIILRYLKPEGSAGFYDPESNQVTAADVPDDVRLATIVLVGHLYREPDADTEKAYGLGQLPFAVTALIYSRRHPTMA